MRANLYINEENTNFQFKCRMVYPEEPFSALNISVKATGEKDEH